MDTLALIGLVLGAALMVLSMVVAGATVITLRRFPDPLSRANVQSALAGVALPALTLGVFLVHTSLGGFDLHNALRVLVAIAAFLIVPNVAAFTMGRALVNSASERTPEEQD